MEIWRWPLLAVRTGLRDPGKIEGDLLAPGFLCMPSPAPSFQEGSDRGMCMLSAVDDLLASIYI